MIEKLKEHLSKFDFDVRKTNDARFMDQKVTPDVLCAVSECVVEYVINNPNSEFTKNDIWHSEFAQDLITDSFNKPNLKDADSEYDKFFAMPLKTLGYANILTETKQGNTNFYKVNESEILEYISLRERNALTFLELYLSKVLSDSDLKRPFDRFFEIQDKTSLDELRQILFEFYHQNTAINGEYEPPRIFNKIINILAFKRKLKGTVRGTISKIILPIEEIRYNRINWRDIGKEKGITRDEFNQTLENNDEISGYFNYNVQKAKKFVRLKHPFSEIHRFKEYPGLQAHHIFMVSEYPEIADFPENIIALTPNQHFYRAHPNNKTSIIDRNYQVVCLISKLDSIELSYRNSFDDYSLEDFVHVLNIGLKTDVFEPQMDFEEIKHQIIKQTYAQA